MDPLTQPCSKCGSTKTEWAGDGHCDVHERVCFAQRCSKCGTRECVRVAESLRSGEEALSMLRSIEGEVPS